MKKECPAKMTMSLMATLALSALTAPAFDVAALQNAIDAVAAKGGGTAPLHFFKNTPLRGVGEF